jgi:hypothetical protein
LALVAQGRENAYTE